MYFASEVIAGLGFAIEYRRFIGGAFILLRPLVAMLVPLVSQVISGVVGLIAVARYR
jgi:hypothetical protein